MRLISVYYETVVIVKHAITANEVVLEGQILRVAAILERVGEWLWRCEQRTSSPEHAEEVE